MYSAVHIQFPLPYKMSCDQIFSMPCLCRTELNYLALKTFSCVCCRVFVLVLVVVSVLWIPVVQASQGGQLFIYIQSISTYLQPPVSIIFLTGCFWKRTNEKVRWNSLRPIKLVRLIK